MTIADVLGKDFIILNVRARRKRAAIKEFAAHVAKRLEGVDRESLIRALDVRERIGSTAIGEALAVPHCKLESVKDLVACFGRSRRGVDFEAANGQRTHFIFLLVAPAGSKGRHLAVLAQISRLFNDPELRAKLMAAETVDELYEVLVGKESI